jgi:hypothetical protein
MAAPWSVDVLWRFAELPAYSAGEGYWQGLVRHSRVRLCPRVRHLDHSFASAPIGTAAASNNRLLAPRQSRWHAETAIMELSNPSPIAPKALTDWRAALSEHEGASVGHR